MVDSTKTTYYASIYSGATIHDEICDANIPGRSSSCSMDAHLSFPCSTCICTNARFQASDLEYDGHNTASGERLQRRALENTISGQRRYIRVLGQEHQGEQAVHLTLLLGDV